MRRDPLQPCRLSAARVSADSVSDVPLAGVSASVLSLVPGSSLDRLAWEEPQSKCAGWWYLPDVYVDYDRGAFEYLISRCNQLRCHAAIITNEDFPSITEASIPSTIDRLAVHILAQSLGISIVLQ